MKPKVCKIIVLGDSGVGKTTIINMYINDEFRADFKSTIGADFSSKVIEIGKENVELQIWDTAGQERFFTVGNAFFRGTDSILLYTTSHNGNHLITFKHGWMTYI